MIRLPIPPAAYSQQWANQLAAAVERELRDVIHSNATASLGALNVTSLTINGAPAPGTGTVTSVNASGGTTGLAFGGGPIITAGTLTLSGTLAIANGGTGATSAAAARAALGAGTVTSVSGAGGATGLTLTGGPITTTGTLTLGGTLAIGSGGTGATTAAAARTALGAGVGSVTSVALTPPNIFTVSGSPITSAGTFVCTLANQAPNQVWAGPASGGAAAPAFRVLALADMPKSLGTLFSSNTAVSAAIANTITLTDFSLTATLPANYLSAGSVIRIRAAGTYATGAAPTLFLQIKFGGAAVLTVGPFLLVASVTNGGWEFETTIVCPATGAAVNMFFTGHVLINGSPITAGVVLMPAPQTLSRSTTGTLAIAASAQWGTASTSNTITMTQFVVETLVP